MFSDPTARSTSFTSYCTAVETITLGHRDQHGGGWDLVYVTSYDQSVSAYTIGSDGSLTKAGDDVHLSGYGDLSPNWSDPVMVLRTKAFQGGKSRKRR